MSEESLLSRVAVMEATIMSNQKLSEERHANMRTQLQDLRDVGAARHEELKKLLDTVILDTSKKMVEIETSLKKIDLQTAKESGEKAERGRTFAAIGILLSSGVVGAFVTWIMAKMKWL